MYVAYEQNDYGEPVTGEMDFISLEEASEFFGITTGSIGNAANKMNAVQGNRDKRWMVFKADDTVSHVEAMLGLDLPSNTRSVAEDV